MSQRGAWILTGLFVVAFALLGIGQCGYKRIQALQSLDNAEDDVTRKFLSVDFMTGGQMSLYQKTLRSIVLVDARSPEEFEVSHLEGAVNLTDEQEVLDFLETQSQPIDHVVIYGALGYRSAELVEKLEDQGVENVSYLKGGIFRWVNQGREVVDSNGSVINWVHPYNKHWGRLLDKEHRFVLKTAD